MVNYDIVLFTKFTISRDTSKKGIKIEYMPYHIQTNVTFIRTNE